MVTSTSTVMDTALVEQFFPAPTPDARPVHAPVTQVTLLEDRAQVMRSGKVELTAGLNRLIIKDVAPVIQDVSLRAEVTGGRVADVRIRRAMRVVRAEKPEAARELEEAIEQLRRRVEQTAEDRQQLEERLRRTAEVLVKGLNELPEDVAWGLVNPQAWHDTFESLFKRSRALREAILEHHHRAEDGAEQLRILVEKRLALDRPDMAFVAWLEVDVVAEGAGSRELAVHYTVPNAVWRPLHSARLKGDGTLHFSCSAAVWQRTGEDWQDATLLFSTARSSLGTEPPLLNEDRLTAQKKAEQVVVQARQVAVQRASVSPGGSAANRPAAPRTVDLPGVDDGGEVRNLKAPAPATVPSNGRPNILPLFAFDAESRTSLVAFPELEPKAFLRAVQRNRSPLPILAGPVELVQKNGFVGWTQVLFVAPGEEFELSFGPDDAMRITRTERKETDKETVDTWQVNTLHVELFLSNLGGETRTVEVTERIPVSEIEQVKVDLVAKKCSPETRLNDNGFCTWTLELPARTQQRINLWYKVSTAPGVQGLLA